MDEIGHLLVCNDWDGEIEPWPFWDTSGMFS